MSTKTKLETLEGMILSGKKVTSEKFEQKTGSTRLSRLIYELKTERKVSVSRFKNKEGVSYYMLDTTTKKRK